MKIAVTAIGTANPTYRNHQLATAELIIAGLNLKPAQKRLLRSVYKATGIEYRHSVLSDYCKTPGQFEFFPNDPDDSYPTTSERMKIYKDNALKLAITAIQNCLANLDNFDFSEITHLITVSCTGMYAPGIDIEIVQQLNLNSSTKRTAINFMGCYGAFNGMKVADAICKADSHATVLMVCVELCTIHFQKNMTLDNIISNSIFSDGAAAVLIQANPKCKKYLSLEKFHCDLLPKTSQEMAWHIGDNGFDIVLSSYVPDVIQSGIAAFTISLLNQYKFNLSDIDFFAIHPGGLKILQACEKSLSITEKQNKYSYQVLKNYGNMSSATILFVLKAIWDDMTQQDHNKNIFSCAFGPGLTLESMLLMAHHV
jgi:predicted naringenin-chalcone synthase